jgi:hypothetical protein
MSTYYIAVSEIQFIRFEHFVPWLGEQTERFARGGDFAIRSREDENYDDFKVRVLDEYGAAGFIIVKGDREIKQELALVSGLLEERLKELNPNPKHGETFEVKDEFPMWEWPDAGVSTKLRKGDIVEYYGYDREDGRLFKWNNRIWFTEVRYPMHRLDRCEA